MPARHRSTPAAALASAPTTPPGGTRRRTALAVSAVLTAATLAAATLTAAPAASADDAAPAAPFDRSLHLEHADNARDVGGYRTTDGRWVRTGLVFRSNALDDLTPAEWAQLTGRGVNRDVDLRNIVERLQDPDHVPAGVTYEVQDVVGLPQGELPSFAACPALPTSLNTLAALRGTEADDAFTGGAYPLMVCYNGSQQAFANLLRDIAADRSGALVYHCTGGKDRTGWATAVLLTILGVPRETVTQDFLASNTFHGAGSVQRSWLDAAFAQVDASYGSFDRYVSRGLGLSPATVAELRARLLTDAPPAGLS